MIQISKLLGRLTKFHQKDKKTFSQNLAQVSHHQFLIQKQRRKETIYFSQQQPQADQGKLPPLLRLGVKKPKNPKIIFNTETSKCSLPPSKVFVKFLNIC
eukprot:TRINITY_DN19591_c0_g1_i7.p3 TRINITY_DN19591_c0_g1~~TRINITY_DN19591_c0_g1_i7.p3  ORF type:complete len:100 (+),score=1.27 TRINITY_DN19591_c0_g1_i7:694-993(+)